VAKRVADLMSSDVVSIAGDATVGDAMTAFTEHECRHLPVVEDGEVVGVLSDRDLRRVEGLLAQDVGNTSGSDKIFSMPARGLLSGPPITVSADDAIDEAIDRLVQDRVGALVVTDSSGALVGMLSYIDILEAARGLF
jgi:acetoin utilization protein AcuB